MSASCGCLQTEVWWVGRKNGKAGGRPESEEVVVSSEEGHMPDPLSCREDVTLFAPIVPLCAETLKTRIIRLTAGMRARGTEVNEKQTTVRPGTNVRGIWVITRPVPEWIYMNGSGVLTECPNTISGIGMGRRPLEQAFH